MAALVLSSVQGGQGKTTLSVGIHLALRLHGYNVSRFTVGPGLALQPPRQALHQLPERPAGLDGWLLTADAARACFHSMSSTADISLIEGCLGMFDSPTADGSEEGSTAQLAAWLRAPVVLIIDAQAFNTPRSILALVRGHSAADGSCSVAGLILNKVTKQGLAAETQEALKQAGLDVAVLGSMPQVPVQLAQAIRSADVSDQQDAHGAAQQEQLAQLVADSIDLQLLRQVAATAAVPQPQTPLPPAARTFRVSIGVAHDEAFYQYFQQNLHMLRLAGVQLVPFSPLHDTQLPPGLSGVLLGGGAVAEHAAQLSSNAAMLGALRAFAQAGGLVVGEAGGLMYLSQSLQRQQHGQRHFMVGLFPFHTQAQPQHGPCSHSYVNVTVKQQAQHPLLVPGMTMRGLATCCCYVLEERPVGSLATAMAAAAAHSQAAQQEQRLDRQRTSSGGGSSSTDVPLTPPAYSSSTSSAAGGSPQQQVAEAPPSYTYSYSCTPLTASTDRAADSAAAAAAAGVDEGYTSGTVLASAVQVHYGSCPELVQHMAQRCLRVDVATVTAAAAAAAKQAAAAASAGLVQHSVGVVLPDSPKGQCSTAGSSDYDSMRLPSPGSRALSAPNLQDMVWHRLQASPADPVAAATAGAATAAGTKDTATISSSSTPAGDAWFCAPGAAAGSAVMGAPVGALSPARKSSSVPGGMWQMAAADLQQQDAYQPHQAYARYHYQQLQQPLGLRVGSCPNGAQGLLQGLAGATGSAGGGGQGPGSDTGSSSQQGARWSAPAFNVPKRWSMELQRIGSSLTSQLLQGGYRSEGGSPKGPQQQQVQQQQCHSRSNSRGMMHLPEEAPLSEAAIRILDQSLPALLGRTHHTHLGVAVPLSSSSAGGAASKGATAGPAGNSNSSSGTAYPGALGLDSRSRSSSVHEQMSSLAAILAQQQQEAADRANSCAAAPQGRESSSDRDSAGMPGSEQQLAGHSATPAFEQQQQQVHHGGGLHNRVHNLQHQQRLSLDHVGVAASQPPETSKHSCSRLSLDTPTAFAAAAEGPLSANGSLLPHKQLPQQQEQAVVLGAEAGDVGFLQPEVSLKAGLGPCAQQQHGAYVGKAGGAVTATAVGAGLTLPPQKAHNSSSSLSNMWQGIPKASAAAAAAAGGHSSSPGYCGSIISLSPAATDCLIALGLCSRVAGVTDACRLAGRTSSNGGSGGGAGSSNSSNSGSGGSCWQVLQLLEAMGAPWVAEAVEAVTGAHTPGVVCRLVEGADGLPRYKLDEDGIRQLQPSLVVVACDENSGEEPHMQHYQQLKSRGGGPVGASSTAQHGSSRGSGYGSSGNGSSTVNAAVAVPGRVRLEPHVVQRVLQRAGVWGEGRAVVLYQRCHSLCEVLEFMQVLAQAAGVPDRGEILVEGLRGRLRAAAARVCLASEALASSAGNRSLIATGSGNRRSSRRGVSGGGAAADTAALLAVGDSALSGGAVVVLSCISPLSLTGFWVPEMLQMLGLEPTTLSPAPAEPHAEVTWAQLRDAAPAVLVLALPGLPAAQAAMHLADLASLPGFWSLPAVRAGAVYAVDHVLLMRPGPGLVLGLELLSHLASPGDQPLPAGLPMGSVLKLSLHGGQRCRPRLAPHYMARYC